MIIIAGLPEDIANAIVNTVGTAISHAVTGTLTSLVQSVGTIIALIGYTPLELTVNNPVVHGAWLTMVGTADGFLGLYVTTKMIQTMYANAVGAVRLPVGQFVAKVLLTVILIHASAFIGSQIITIVNLLCQLVLVNIGDFMKETLGQLGAGQTIGLMIVLMIIFGFGLIRFVLQAVKRVIFFNVLFVLSGPAFLMSLDAQTSPWFVFWVRLYVVTAFTQFFQFLTFGLGLQFLLATGQTGIAGFVLAIALLSLVTEIPAILARFSGAYYRDVTGVEQLLSAAVQAATLFV